MQSPSLAVLPTAYVRVLDGDRVVMTRKLVEGLSRYAALWDGSMTVLIESSNDPSDNLDEAEFRRSELPFQLKVVDFFDPNLAEDLVGHDLVLAAAVHNQYHIAKICHPIGVGCVYITEYSLRTRRQITNATAPSLARRFVRNARDWRHERRFRTAIRLAVGVQCNGTPTYEAFRKINRNPLLYFDTRAEEATLITDQELAQRTASMRAGAPLRLIFSGRLASIKGADHLVNVANEVRRLGIPFEMRICGGGTLEPLIRRQIEELKLGDQVKLLGVLNYQTELMPLTKQWADLFVCCHPTGDPSCTYLEVMSCGVPIVGYNNEAFAGVVRQSGTGWALPMGKPRLVARKIADLAHDRESLQVASGKALSFAREHTFERTFEARIRHLQSCLEPHPAVIR